MALIDKLKAVRQRYDELTSLLSQPETAAADNFIKLSQEYSELGPIVETINRLFALQKTISETQELVNDPLSDTDMQELAQMELESAQTERLAVENDVQRMLLPKDEADAKNAILEIRPGTGGDEAGLFAADLFRMYQRFADLNGWKMEVLDLNDNDVGGLKDVSARISGTNVFARLKYESGVHRVQRVPATESSGRIHTSAATVAVLPEAEEVDIDIRPNEIRIDTMRASGAGGQHVNTTDSAVRITHLETGIVVTQSQKSQHRNRDEAMRMLMARLYDLYRGQVDAERAEERRSQIGSGDRSERIRTYNFPQGRVTDHRIHLTMHRLEAMLNGEALGELIDALTTEDETRRLLAFGETA